MPIIECTLIRKLGTVIEFDKQHIYHFLPCGPENEHLCEVSNTEHVEKLLAVPESFRLFAGVPAAKRPAKHQIEESNTKQDGVAQHSARLDLSDEEKAKRKAAQLAYNKKFNQPAPAKWSTERIEQELNTDD